MRLQELDTKDHQLDELKIGQAVGAVGTGVGKAAGGVAKGLGAVAGGIAGLGSAFKKGFQTGKSTTSGDNQAPAAGSAGAGGAAGTAGTAGTGGSAGAGGAGGSAGTGGAAGAGGTGGAAGAAGAGGQGTSDKISILKDRIMKLDDASRQDIMKILQKQAATAKSKPQQDQSKRGVEQPGKPTFTGVPEKPTADADQSTDQGGSKLTPGAFGKMTQDLTKPLAGADSETPVAALPQTGGGKQAGTLSMTPDAIRKRQSRAAKKRTSHPADDNPNVQLGTESLSNKTKKLFNENSFEKSFSLFRK